MNTVTKTYTEISDKEVRDLLREPMLACGYNVGRLVFQVGRAEILGVAGNYNLAEPAVGTLAELIEDLKVRDLLVRAYELTQYLAMLTEPRQSPKPITC